jgi:hypothetical protein
MPTNFPKLQFLLNQLPQSLLTKISSLDWIDFGPGPGSLGLGLAHRFGTEGKTYIGIENSEAMCKQGQKLFDHYAPKVSSKFVQKVPQDLQKDQLLLLGNVVNEMGPDYIMELIRRVDPSVLIFLDIGTKDSFAKLLTLRGRLLGLSYEVNYPCLTNGPCPMADTDNWCHQKLFVTQEPEFERIGQLLKNDRRSLPLTSFIFSKEKTHSEQNQVRLIQKYPDTKFGFSFQGCNEKGELDRYELFKKHMEKSEQKVFKKIDWGEKVSYESKEAKGNGFRLILKK